MTNITWDRLEASFEAAVVSLDVLDISEAETFYHIFKYRERQTGTELTKYEEKRGRYLREIAKQKANLRKLQEARSLLEAV